MADIGQLQKAELTQEMKRAYLDYAMSVIVDRALPDVRDGLKPVHRRILYAMHEMGLDHSSKYKKSATVVGEVLGKYHPHGDVPVYDAMVRLAQDFSMRYPLVDGQGNFGSLDGDPPAAMRYCVIGQTLVVTDKGIIPIQSISSDKNQNIAIDVLSRNKKVHSASMWFDSGIHPTIKITTKQGFSLQGTYNHPILTWVKDVDGKPTYAWKLLQDIVPKDIVVLDRTADILWPTKELSTKKFIPNIANPRIEKKSLPKSINNDLAFILGSLIAEGTLNNPSELEFCNSDAVWIEEFEKRWTNIFPDTRLHKFTRQASSYGKKTYQTLEIHSTYVIAFLRNLGLGTEKSHGRRIPFSILQSPKYICSSFLRAYFEGDGTVTTSKRLVELSAISTSELLVHELQILLLRFGILATKRFDKYRNTHKLYIRGLRNYKLFHSEIGFLSQRKNKKLETILHNTHKDSSLLDYVPFVKEYVYHNMDKTLSYDNLRAFVYKHNFDRYTTMQQNYSSVVPSLISTLQPEVQKLFQTLLSQNYIFDQIETISKEKPQKVFSIKVDSDCHSFVANGFINHNTEARMASITSEMLWDLDKETVDTRPNFDSSRQEPVYLPAKLPNLLLMGAEGIAVGMATKIPPHNLSEVIDAIQAMIGKTKFGKGKEENVKGEEVTLTSDIAIEELFEYIKGPDFPTRGAIYDQMEIRSLYTTGKGKILIRGKAEIEDIGQGKSAIIITELPYQVNKALLVARIADLAKEKKIEGISDLRDESDRHGLRIMIELKRDAAPKKVLNNLYKHTALQTSFPGNIVALVDGTPQTLTLKAILEEYLKHRFSVITRRSEFELRQAKARLHILEGLKIAVDHIDAVIKTIRESKDQEEAKKNLMEKFKLSDLQATAILDMQLRRLAALERQKIEDELLMIKETIAYLEDLLSHPEKILKVIGDELKNLKEKFGDERRTRVYKGKVDEFSEEDLIPNEPTVITITNTGYIKRQSTSSFSTQHRGGKGVNGMTTKEEDEIMNIRYAQTHDNLLFFTNRGKVYQLKAYEIAESSRTSKGSAIVNLLNIEAGERIESFINYQGKLKDTYVFLTTRNGTVKKSKVSEFENIRKSGIVAIKLDKGDELVWSTLTSDDDEVLLVTKEGKAIRFNEKQVRSMGRATQGVRGIKIPSTDEVISMDIVNHNDKEALLLTIMGNGLGKKTLASEFRGQSRGGMGVKVANVTEKTGKVAVSQIIPKTCTGLIITSKKGQVVKLEIASIPRLSRATQGVILMRFSKANDHVASATCVE